MNFIRKNLVLTAILVILVVGGGFAVVNNYKTNSATKPASASTVEKKTVAKLDITADGKTKHYDLTTGVGKSALEVTQSQTEVKMTGTGVNAFVNEINGRAADSTKKEFWELDINGKMSEVGAGTYTVKENDTISWKIATY